MDSIEPLTTFLVDELLRIHEMLVDARKTVGMARTELVAGTAPGAPFRLNECRWKLFLAMDLLGLMRRLTKQTLGGWVPGADADKPLARVRDELIRLHVTSEQAERELADGKLSEARDKCQRVLDDLLKTMAQLQSLIDGLSIGRRSFG